MENYTLIDYKAIGNRIKLKRLENGQTQEQLAELLGVSNEYMSKIENAKIEINLKRLAELSKILSTPIEFFIAGVITNSPEYKTNELIQLLEDLSAKEKEAVYKIIEQIKLLR